MHALAMATLLAACGSNPPEPTAPLPPLQSRLEAQNRAALTTFEKGRFRQAADLYAQALATATAMDDSSEIVNAHYNRAVSLLLAEDYPEAKHSIQRAEDEATRAGRRLPPELTLLAATLAYRTGEDDLAWDLSGSLIGQDSANEAQVRERAWFLRGLIAKRRKDDAALGRAIAALDSSPNPDTRPDRFELDGYRAAALGEPAAAVRAFDAATRYRNEIGDYRGMSRSLVAAAGVLETESRNAEAADRYLRAGRSAASRGSVNMARLWLQRALELANKADAPSIREEARTQLEQIDESS